MYEKAIVPGDTAMPEISINCTMEEGSKARMKAKISGQDACAPVTARIELTDRQPG
jgi:hypothetical protein